LFIAYAYLPCGGAGVQRTAKFVRYLPDHGWLPTVLTVVPSAYGVLDHSSATEAPPGVEVVRTAHFDPVVSFCRGRKVSFSPNGCDNSAQGFKLCHPRKVVRSVLRGGWLAVKGPK
jgi:hypothetical protein